MLLEVKRSNKVAQPLAATFSLDLCLKIPS